MRSGTEFCELRRICLCTASDTKGENGNEEKYAVLPGNTPNMIINGDALGADSIILDLEDAVSPDEKDSARLLVRSAMKIWALRAVKSPSA